ncbi:MAG TPA: hypothetical protein G4O02_00635 [Caldilineae bacterium]|nr:hypothetical protein [Caldilineae bacterium]
MDSAMIGKIMKARQYAKEPERVHIKSFVAEFQGNHDVYEITYEEGSWHCTCRFFAQRGRCSHTMALEKLLAPMVSFVVEEPASPVVSG